MLWSLWCDEETGTKTLADACLSDRHWDENTRRYLAKLPSLKKMGTCWKLPKWPSDKMVDTWWQRFAGKWLMQARLPTRAGQWLKTTEVSWPKCPKKWAAQESLMKMVVDMS